MHLHMIKFENYVNYAGSKTLLPFLYIYPWFENYVNYAGSKTHHTLLWLVYSLGTM